MKTKVDVSFNHDTGNLAGRVAEIFKKAIKDEGLEESVVLTFQGDDISELRQKLRDDPGFKCGFVDDEVLSIFRDREIDSFEPEITEQVRYNGVSLGMLRRFEKEGQTICQDLDRDDVYEATESIRDKWYEVLHGEMLEDLGGLVLLMYFGTDPSQNVLDAFASGSIRFEALSAEKQKVIFSNYGQYVADLLNGIDNTEISYSVGEGLDS